MGEITRILGAMTKYSKSLTPSSVSANVVAEETFTVTGLKTSDTVVVNGPADSGAVGIAGARVTAADTLGIRFTNPTSGGLTPASGTYVIYALGAL